MGRMVSSEGRSYHAKILAKSKRFANPCFDVTKKPKNLVKHFPPKFIVALHKMVLIPFTNRGLSLVKVMSTILWSARKNQVHIYTRIFLRTFSTLCMIRTQVTHTSIQRTLSIHTLSTLIYLRAPASIACTVVNPDSWRPVSCDVEITR
jgi:hypothetical protein